MARQGVVAAVKRERDEAHQKIQELQQLRDRLNVFLRVWEEHEAKLDPVSGARIDTLAIAIAKDNPGRPISTAEMVDLFSERYGVRIEGAKPAALLSTRLSQHPRFESTPEGWVFVAGAEASALSIGAALATGASTVVDRRRRRPESPSERVARHMRNDS